MVIKHAKRYHWRTPWDALKFVKHLGNITNNQVTDTTIIEVIASTNETEQAWTSAKSSNSHWTVDGLGGVKEYNKQKFLVVSSKYPRRWKDYHDYNLCNIIYKQTSAVDVVSVGSSAKISVWDHVKSTTQEHVDFMSAAAKNHSHLTHCMYDVWKTIKQSHPEWHADIMLLVMPPVQPAGTCRICPGGAPNPALKNVAD
eukprot:9404920-Pyramimonas_sp.AAC.1